MERLFLLLITLGMALWCREKARDYYGKWGCMVGYWALCGVDIVAIVVAMYVWWVR